MFFAKIPRHTRQNAITEGDLECILTRNCEGTEQLRKIDKMDVRTGLYHSFETTVVKPFLSFIEFLGAKALASASNVCKG